MRDPGNEVGTLHVRVPSQFPVTGPATENSQQHQCGVIAQYIVETPVKPTFACKCPLTSVAPNRKLDQSANHQ